MFAKNDVNSSIKNVCNNFSLNAKRWLNEAESVINSLSREILFIRTLGESVCICVCIFQDQFVRKWHIERHIHFAHEFIENKCIISLEQHTHTPIQCTFVH